MCRYVKYTNTTSQLMFVAQEHSIYGSSRVGVDNRKDTLYLGAVYTNTWGGVGTSRRDLGSKSFELANHLGNVLVTVSDKPVNKVSSGTIYFQPEITSISDYYPFGAPIDGRSFSSTQYRFGYNTQEKIDDISGPGNHNTATFWEYDPRLGRRWNMDPVIKPWESLYACLSDNPILLNDPDGLYSRLGAWWRSKRDGGTQIYKRGKEWGYNTTQAHESGVEYGQHFSVHFGNEINIVGKIIRSFAGSDFSKSLFTNYWKASGDIVLSQSRFDNIVKSAGRIESVSNVTLANGQSGIAKVHYFYESSEYKNALGSAIIYYDQTDTPVGFMDTYDFNWRCTWTKRRRAYWAERKTRLVSAAGFIHGAKPFKITYGLGVLP